MHIRNKILILSFIILMFTFCYDAFSLFVYANGNTSMMINPDEYDPTTTDLETSTFNTKAGKIIGVFQVIGSIVSVLALVLLGIKYMLGSAEEKADYKQSMIYYLIGAILVFAISNISAIIYETVK